MYFCLQCKIETKFLNNFRSHLNTKSHLNKCNLTKTCFKCLRTFKHAGNLTNHLKTCNKDLAPKKDNNQKSNIKIKDSDKTVINNINGSNVEINQEINQGIQEFNININIQPESIDTFLMSIKDLEKDSMTTTIHKMILRKMNTDSIGIMDLVDRFDELTNPYIESQYESHRKDCFDKNSSFVVIGVCSHTERNFAIYNIPDIENIIHNTIFGSINKLVVTHKNSDFTGDNKLILFKHLDNLHKEEVVMKMIKSSKTYKENKIILPDGFNLASSLRKNYNKFYEELSELVIKYYGDFNLENSKAAKKNKKEVDREKRRIKDAKNGYLRINTNS